MMDEKRESDAEPTVFEPERDWFLQTIIALADEGVELGVTLTTPGGIVSGVLIGGRKYFLELASVMQAAGGGEAKEGSALIADIASSWSSLSSIYDRPEDAPEDWRRPPAGFIHLRNARTFSPGGDSIPDDQDGVLWRGRLGGVIGFTLGSLSVAKK